MDDPICPSCGRPIRVVHIRYENPPPLETVAREAAPPLEAVLGAPRDEEEVTPEAEPSEEAAEPQEAEPAVIKVRVQKAAEPAPINSPALSAYEERLAKLRDQSREPESRVG